MKLVGKAVEKGSIADIQAILDEEDVRLHFPQVDFGPYTLTKVNTSQCKLACPLDTNVKGYLGLIAAGKFDRALELIKRTNPFPGICGRVCIHPCETECNRGEIDKPIAIRALKRFVADYELRHAKGKVKSKPIKQTKKEKVAIVGSGPAGLTAANDLIRLGYGVTVFEALPIPGGMLCVGIPAYQLPREIIQAEIAAISALGVEIRTDTKIEGVDSLLKDGYKAVFIAIGSHKGLKLGIPGEDEFEGVVDSITFLRKVNLGDRKRPGTRVVVIGGGNSAMASARTALRLGCDDVYLVYHRSKDEMPVDETLVEEAGIEGVKIRYITTPVKILGKNGKVVGVKCVRMRTGEPDIMGRRQLNKIEGSNFVINADAVITAVNQEPDLSFLPRDHGFEISRWNLFVVDLNTMATNKPGIFAGGDAVTGPKTVIEAIAAGHRVAVSIDQYLRGKDLKEHIAEEEIEMEEWELSTDYLLIEKEERIQVPKLSLYKRRDSFEEVELSLSDGQAIGEAKRCLRCGPCIECVECSSECNKKLIALSPIDSVTEDLLIRVQWIPDRFPSIDEPWHAILRWSKEEIPVIMETVTSMVREDFCRGCGKCEEICEYSAIKLIEKKKGVFVAKVDQTICRGCGTCASICPSSAIIAKHFTDSWINANIEQKLQRL